MGKKDSFADAEEASEVRRGHEVAAGHGPEQVRMKEKRHSTACFSDKMMV